MNRFRSTAALLINLVLVSFPAIGQSNDESSTETAAIEHSKRVFLIGNSLTWDTVPARLDGNVQWHVDCGKNLRYMYDNPNEPCVKSSTLWPDALNQNQYDVVCVQPHYGSTLEEDVDVIGRWLKLQPDAIFVIHTGWARSASLREEFAVKNAEGKLHHSNAYFDQLLVKLRKQHSSRQFSVTAATRLLNEIAADVELGRAPVKKIEDLYRDAIHMTTSGRYLMHNAIRHAIGQDPSQAGFEKVPEELRVYIDGKLGKL